MKKKLNMLMPAYDDDGCTFVENLCYYINNDKNIICLQKYAKLRHRMLAKLYDLQVGSSS